MKNFKFEHPVNKHFAIAQFKLALMFFLFQPTLSAQNFSKEATLEKASENGFHRILLSPEISSAIKGNFSNIRLFDSNNNEIPYIFSEEAPTASKIHFREYEILKKEIRKNCCTNLILKNPERHNISNIGLFIKNAETTKKARLTGSDDGENWFAIKESFYFHGINNRESTMELKSIEFPRSNYALYALSIDDSTSAPLNIVKAGFYETESESGNYIPITGLEYLQSDSGHSKKTFVRIAFPDIVLMDKMEFSIEGPAYYLRNAKLMVKQVRVLKKGKKTESLMPLQYFALNSAKPNSFFLPAIKASELFLEIDNQDAPPLKFLDVKAFQINRYLIADLEAGEAYVVRISAKDLPGPVYDLVHFKDSIPKFATVLKTNEISDIGKQQKVSEATFFTNKLIIWAAVIGVILLLGILSFKMVRETGKDM